tara:strand:- start:70 stop:762 length:693 start_codon:yes stop_codon:yes gene_type:complete
MKTYAFIFARGGSKGLPRKNLLKINGLSLVEHSINIALGIESINQVYVSTEDSEIASISSQSGAEIIKRPLHLAADDSPEWLSWQHAVNYVLKKEGKFDNFLSLPPTSPLRSIDDVEKCLNKLDASNDIVISITKSRRNPWFNMVKFENNFLELVNNDEINIKRRQDTPNTFDIGTVAYVCRPEFILKNNSIWDGKVSGVEIPFERSIDIDDLVDFEIATFLADRKKGDS